MNKFQSPPVMMELAVDCSSGKPILVTDGRTSESLDALTTLDAFLTTLDDSIKTNMGENVFIEQMGRLINHMNKKPSERAKTRIYR